MIILGIETSCDETSASLVLKTKNKIKVLSHIVLSQIKIHQKYGGVIPEIAAREHVLHILPIIDKAIKKAQVKKEKINAIAVTTGPGLISSLLSGIETARVLSYVWRIPIIEINHIKGHIYANFLNKKEIIFPSLALTVSGGHTALVLMKNHKKYKLLGETRDDAVGEAFDKVARLMDLSYPGGPIISKMAQRFKGKTCLKFPRPMINSLNYDFSFSGLKTAVLYELKKDKDWKKRIPEYCKEFQNAVIDVLIKKTIKAGKEFKVKSIMLAGGVSANLALRKKLKIAIKTQLNNVSFFMPDLKYTTDNATMIAVAGIFEFENNNFTKWQELKVKCNLRLS